MRSRRPQAPAPPPPPVPEGLLDEFHSREFGVLSGKVTNPELSTPTPAPPAPLEIPPPDWTAEAAERGETDAPAPPPPLAAVVTGDEFDPPAPDLRPPEYVGPLIRPSLPAPDWRAEEQERREQP